MKLTCILPVACALVIGCGRSACNGIVGEVLGERINGSKIEKWREDSVTGTTVYNIKDPVVGLPVIDSNLDHGKLLSFYKLPRCYAWNDEEYLVYVDGDDKVRGIEVNAKQYFAPSLLNGILECSIEAYGKPIWGKEDDDGQTIWVYWESRGNWLCIKGVRSIHSYHGSVFTIKISCWPEALYVKRLAYKCNLSDKEGREAELATIPEKLRRKVRKELQ